MDNFKVALWSFNFSFIFIIRVSRTTAEFHNIWIVQSATEVFGMLLDTQYFLRHSFATTCVQYVRPDIVDTWMGDSSERLVGRVYTHFPDKFMTNQMDLVQFEF